MAVGKKQHQEVSQSLKQKHPRNKKNKFCLVFDDAERTDFLTGFRKRKNERRVKAQEQREQLIKDEKKRKRDKHRQLTQKHVPSKRCQQLPDMEDIVQSETYDLPNHTVTVTDVTEVDFVGTSGLMLGVNQVDADETKTEKSEVPDSATQRKIKKLLRPDRNFKKSKHINYAHRKGKKKMTTEDRRRLKNKIKKQEKRHC